MTWWVWTLIWVVLVVGALYAIFLVGRSLVRKGMALLDELGAASERLAAVTEELQTLSDRTAAPAQPPAVFADPGTLRAERIAARRGGRGTRKRDPSRRRA